MINYFESALPWLLLLSLLHSQFLPSLGEMMCEDLPTEYCAFSIASSGKRCVLEHSLDNAGRKIYDCKTSEVVVERMSEYMETESCVNSCGVDRKTAGISSDALLEPESLSKICSPACFNNCPNLVDLYSNLSAAEGGYLPVMCEEQRRNPRRVMVELMSSGAAPGPVSPIGSGVVGGPSPASSPAPFS